MTQNTFRKEPIFGEPLATAENTATVEQPEADKPAQPKQPLSFSVHSNQSPGHTFTPVMKRPVETAQHLATLEEQKMLEAEKNTAPVQAATAVPPAPKTSFAFTPVGNETAETVHPTSAAQPVAAIKPTAVDTTAVNATKTSHEQPKAETMTTNNIERVISTQAPAAPKKPTVAEKVPSKYRRLLLVALLALALILVFFLLRPKTPETVEELQEQGTSLPIEFRPVNEAEAKRAEEEAKALQQQQEAEQQALAAQQAAQQAQTATPAENSVVATTENTQQAVQNSENSANASEQAVVAAKPAPVVNKPVVIEPVKKPSTAGSVIHQPEHVAEPAKVAKPAVQKVETVVKNEPVKAATQLVKVKAEPAKEAAKPTSATVATKPAQSAQPANTATAPATTAASSAVASKTITVQKGVSLFQNFRDNGLEANLPELNKMTKLNGETSRLSPGQKITVRLDSNKHIVEMNIGSGKYIRQADGSYIYK